MSALRPESVEIVHSALWDDLPSGEVADRVKRAAQNSAGEGPQRSWPLAYARTGQDLSRHDATPVETGQAELEVDSVFFVDLSD